MHGNSLVALGCPLQLALALICYWALGHLTPLDGLSRIGAALVAAAATHWLLALLAGWLNGRLLPGPVGEPVWPEREREEPRGGSPPA